MPVREDKREQVRQKLLVTQPVTADITRPFQSALYYFVAAWRLDKLPPFNLWVADLMRFDQQVAFGLMVRSGPLMAATVTVESEDEEVAAFVQGQWDRIWRTSARKILLAQLYGYLGFEVMYEEDASGNVSFKKLKDLHPSMCRPLTSGNEVQGMRVRPHGSFGYYHSVLEQNRDAKFDPRSLVSPKSLWCTYGSRFENPFGEPLLEKCYSAWWEKWMEHGAKRSCQLRMLKDAWIGDIFYYPPNMKLTKPDGTELPWRDVLREVAENRLSGGSLCLPMLRDEKGGQLVEYKPPQAIGGETSIFQWQELTNIEIWKGMGIPKEVLEASGTGSGFSGRSIPFIAFITSLLEQFQEHVEDIDRQILRPITYLNYLRKPEYELRPIEVGELIQKLTGGSSPAAMGGAGIGMGLAGGAPFGGGPSGAPVGRQFSEEQKPEKIVVNRTLSAAQKQLPTVHQIMGESGASQAAASRARVLVAAAQLSDDVEPSAKGMLSAAQVTTDTSSITESLKRLRQRLVNEGLPMAAYRFADEDFLHTSSEADYHDRSGDEDEDDDGAFDDDLDEDDWDNDDDEAEYGEGEVGELDDLSEQDVENDEAAIDYEEAADDEEEDDEDED